MCAYVTTVLLCPMMTAGVAKTKAENPNVGSYFRETTLEPMSGIEPETYGLRNRCSTPELHRQNEAVLRDSRLGCQAFSLVVHRENQQPDAGK